MKSMLQVCILAFLLLPVFTLGAIDAGLLLDQSGIYDYTEQLQFLGTLIPRFSIPIGEASELYISAGLTVKYEIEKGHIIPELLRTELTLRMDEKGELHIGRMYYTDPLGFIASGLFDGIRYVREMDNNSLIGVGMWYTGFLYKKNANITMTEAELDNYNAPVDYADFFDTYFAPPRMVIAVDWEHPGIKESIRLRLAFISQFDLTFEKRFYHTQYFVAKAIIPANNIVFELGGTVELVENSRRFQISFAGELGIAWMLPTQINDRLSFSALFSSGTVNNTFVAFNPVSTEAYGDVLSTKLRGISILRLDYTARLHQSFSFGLRSSYFILNDKASFSGPIPGNDGYFLGNEFYGFMVWSPLSDLQIKIGGGAFLPSLGNAARGSDVLWKAELGAVLSLF